MNEELEPLAILFGIFVVVVVAYLAAWRSKGKRVQKSGSVVVAAIAGLAALAVVAFAIQGLRAFSNPLIPLWQTFLAETIAFAIAVGLGLFAVKSLEAPQAKE